LAISAADSQTTMRRSCRDGRSIAPFWHRTAAFLRLRCFLQIEHNVLARAMHPDDPLALERRGDDAGGRLERLFPRTDPDRFDGVSGGALIETADDGFNFGEFGTQSGYRCVVMASAVQTERNPITLAPFPPISRLLLHSSIRMLKGTHQHRRSSIFPVDSASAARPVCATLGWPDGRRNNFRWSFP